MASAFPAIYATLGLLRIWHAKLLRRSALAELRGRPELIACLEDAHPIGG
jgi:hypothetical protein